MSFDATLPSVTAARSAPQPSRTTVTFISAVVPRTLVVDTILDASSPPALSNHHVSCVTLGAIFDNVDMDKMNGDQIRLD